MTLARGYESYGSGLRSVGDGTSAYAFAGEQVDVTGLSYNRARYYSGTIARFLTKDTYKGNETSPITQHRYLYSFNNPTNLTDPSGHNPCLAVLAGGPPGVTVTFGCIVIVVAGYYIVVQAGQYLVKHGDEVAAAIDAQCRAAQQFAQDLFNENLPVRDPERKPEIFYDPSRQPDIDTDDLDQPEYIYRIGRNSPKTLSLHRIVDWETGLSFYDYEPGPLHIKFKVSTLRAAGYAVRFDGGLPMERLWDGEPYINPYTGQQERYPEGHVTVYYPEKRYWDEWHFADLENLNTPRVSPQLQAIYSLREP